MADNPEENRRLLSSSELPECEGPKLKAFPHRNSKITWIDWINQENSPSVSGGQGYVFKVKIRSVVYALKVFKFFNPSTYRPALNPFRQRDVTDLELAFHTDPFYAECRAYAQIETKRKIQGLKRKDIADCYGFLALSKADEDILASYRIDLWGDIPIDDEYRRKAMGSPVRALVKEYIEEEVDMNEETLKHALKTIKWMNRNKILMCDIHPQNWKGGYFLDFGLSWTQPHCLWKDTSRYILPVVLTVDIVRFEEMLEDLGLPLRRSSRPSYRQA